MNTYKIIVLNSDGNIFKNISFSGNDNSHESKLDIFSESQSLTETIQDTVYSKQQIHRDDSIRIIKNKILRELDYKYAYEEMYMFGQVKQKINMYNVYTSITENEKIPMTSEMLGQLLMNLNMDESLIKNIEPKRVYYYEDLLKFQNENNEYQVTIPIGQKFAKKENYLFSANPFSIFSYNTLYDSNDLVSFENTLLLNYGEFVDDTIYICFAEDMYKYGEVHDIDEEYICETYYPLLFQNEIKTNDELDRNRSKLISKYRSSLDTRAFQLYETIDLFHNIFNGKKRELEYEENGIQSFEIMYKTGLNTIIPLEIIFKNIHASQNVPFIKFNPGNLRENIYRFYSEKKSKNGKKIPFLSETNIAQLSRKMGKGRQISMYLKSTYTVQDREKAVEVYIDIENNGDIRISGDVKYAIVPGELNILIETAVNQVINNLNGFLQQSGYHIPLFTSLNDQNVDVVNMKYVMKIIMTKDIVLHKYENCLSTIFDIMSTDISSGAELIFKRVDNYLKSDEKQMLIKSVYEKTKNLKAMIDALTQTYKMSEDEAKEIIVEYFNDITEMRGKIVENPGFPVKMYTEPLQQMFVITVDGINSIHFLSVIHLYLESFLIITQNPEITDVPLKDINNICLKAKYLKKEIDKSKIENVIAKDSDLLEAPKITNLDKIFIEDIPDDEDIDDDMGLFYEDEDEDNENVEFEGGDETSTPDSESTPTSETSDETQQESKSQGNFQMNIDGMKLSNPNIFEERIKSRDRKLFFTKDGNYSAYSRACESNIRRQPVILTQKEKDDIDKNHKGSYNHAIKYGSDPKNPFWYICPRYWCLKTNSSITQEEVDSGVCGKIIPHGAKTIPNGHYIYEFNHHEEHVRKDGTYIDHYPGFLDVKKHSDGHCLPCCFSKWDSEYMRKRRQKCSQDEKPSDSIVTAQKTGNYIMGIDKYPLDQNRWGFLPFSVQSFLQTNNGECVTKNNPALVKPNTNCILRYGVEKSKNQSFIACIADVYSNIQNVEETPTIVEMKDILVNAITLDSFLQYQNGALTSIFKPKRLDREVDIDKYAETDFMKSIDTNNTVQLDFLEITIIAYENFIEYLKNNDIVIDHTYLWDCITQPNSNLMKEGVNMVILEISNKDITDNMEILCPTNSQSSLLYDSRKPTIILLKHGVYYEPIYIYNDDSAKIVKVFSEHNSPKNIRKILNMIQKTTKKYCPALPGLPGVYEFKNNMEAKDIANIMKSEKYVIESQVMNYQNKIIGFTVKTNEDDKNHIFVPTKPSAVLSNVERKYMEDKTLWNDYKTTRDGLTTISRKTNGKIPCKPVMRIIEDGLIVGILTETNQFVQLSEPTENNENDGLLQMSGLNYSLADNIIETTSDYDKERVETIKKIQLESQFYDVFRGMIRNMINDYSNRHVRKQILELIDNRHIFYKDKLKKIDEIVRNLAKNKIVFSEIDSKIWMNLSEVTTCSIDCQPTAYCLVTENKECQFIIPSKQLVSGKNNENMYYGRISDEILRYKRVQMFMLHAKTFLNIGHIDYKINADEFLLLHSMLTSEYFKDLDVFNTNEYIRNVDYENAMPILFQKYSNEAVSTEEQNNIVKEETTTQEIANECIHIIRDVVGNTTNSLWKRIFSNKKFTEIAFVNNPFCSFHVLLYILQDKLKKTLTVENLKVTLWNAYSKYYEKYATKILIILKKQGKKKILENVVNQKTTFEEIIFSDSYFLTDLDIWMLSDKLKLPIVLFSSTKLNNLIDTIDWLVMSVDLSQPFYFIRSPQNLKPESKSGYQLIVPPVLMSEVKEFSSLLQNKLLKNKESPSEHLIKLHEYLENYVYIKK